VFALVVVRRPADGKFLLVQVGRGRGGGVGVLLGESTQGVAGAREPLPSPHRAPLRSAPPAAALPTQPQEFAGQGFWLPGGGVDAGESLTAAALRETREEGGVDASLTGLLCCESHARGAWRRVIFLGQPAGDDAVPPSGGGGGGDASSSGSSLPAPHDSPKTVRRARGPHHSPHRVSPCCIPPLPASPAARPPPPLSPSARQVPDFESAGACWVSTAQLEAGGVPIRSAHELAWLWRVERALAGSSGSGGGDGGGREGGSGGEAAAVLPLAMPPEWAATFADYDF
jgi:ADP-ribose pyrophosphatase YjhB (NUDIX family)